MGRVGDWMGGVSLIGVVGVFLQGKDGDNMIGDVGDPLHSLFFSPPL